jgi:hypothetical protein
MPTKDMGLASIHVDALLTVISRCLYLGKGEVDIQKRMTQTNDRTISCFLQLNLIRAEVCLTNVGS